MWEKRHVYIEKKRGKEGDRASGEDGKRREDG